MSEYAPERLRAASPGKCKHPVWESKKEYSYYTWYYWKHCPLCLSDFDHVAVSDW